MANRIGKALVLINLALSVLLLAFAGAVYFQQLDWGWKEPRQDMTGSARLASEIDQRNAAVVMANGAAEMVLPALRSAQASLARAEPRLYENHRWYLEQLAALENDPKLTEIKEFQYDKGITALDARGDIGKPMFDKAIPGLDMSYQSYVKKLAELEKEIDSAVTDINNVIEKEEKPLTFQLNGKFEGKRIQPGLYELVDAAYQDLVRTKFEIEYLQPRLIEATRQLGQFEERHRYLEDNLARLKQARAGKK